MSIATVETFIAQKQGQLIFYLKGFWDRKIPYKELELYLWDVLEEWQTLDLDREGDLSQKEIAFWHLLHQVQFWSEHKLMNEPYLRTQLNNCIEFIEGLGELPIDCIGVRP